MISSSLHLLNEFDAMGKTARDLRGASADAIVKNLHLMHPSLIQTCQFKTLKLGQIAPLPQNRFFGFPRRLKSEFLQCVARVATRIYHECSFS
jgi:hypothetical protein